MCGLIVNGGKITIQGNSENSEDYDKVLLVKGDLLKKIIEYKLKELFSPEVKIIICSLDEMIFDKHSFGKKNT